MKVIKKLFFLSVLVMSVYACSTDELNAPTEETVRTNEIVHRTLSFEEFYNTFSKDKTLLSKQVHNFAQTKNERLKKANSQSAETPDNDVEIVVDYYYDPIHSNETYSFITKEFKTKGDYLEKFVVTIEEGERKSGYLRYYPEGDTIAELFTGRVELTNAAQTVSFSDYFVSGEPDQRTTYGVMDDCTTRVSFGSTLCSNGGLHKYGEACRPPFTNDAYMYVIVEVVCKNTIPSNIQEMPHQIIDIKPGKTGGSGGTSTSTIKFENFVNILNTATKNWLLENHDIKLIISGYLVQQNFSDASKQTATMLLDLIANDNVLNTNNNRLTEYLIRSCLMGTEFNTQQFIDFWSALTTAEKNILQQFVNANLTAGYFPVIKPSILTFLNWAFPYLINNEDVTVEQFENWFMGKSEGVESLDIYNSSFWETTTLTFPKQELPFYSVFFDNYPDRTINADYLCNQLIGGEITTLYNNIVAAGQIINTCAIRMSYALNYSGINIPNLPVTKLGADGKYYFTFAKDINIWMRKTFGTNDGDLTTPHNPKHTRLTKAQGGINGQNFPNLIENKQGIFSIVSPNGSTWASGHADCLTPDGTCVNDCHFYDGDIEYIDIWELTN